MPTGRPTEAAHDPVAATEYDADVLVIGSGCAGLTAALAAAAAGASVVVLEKSAVLGGTSAMSGAGIWVPANHHAEAAGIADSVEEAVTYLFSASPPGWADTEGELWRSYARHSPDMLRFVEAHSPLRFELVPEPDPMAEHPGGKIMGRMLSPKPYSVRDLGRLARLVRRSTLPHIFTYLEIITRPVFRTPIRAAWRLLPRLAGRWLSGARGQGTALVGGLLQGCVKAGCRFRLNSPVERLLTDETGAVTGLVLRTNGEDRELRARRGVVIATGGFEWDDTMFGRHFPGPRPRIGSPRCNTGDGQRMAAEVGARLERMDQANVFPCIPTRYEGRPHGLPWTFQASPHAIAVNTAGDRFADEYDCSFGEELDRRDPASGDPVNLPAWVIADSRFLANAPVFRWYAAKEPAWIRRAGTLDGLAERIGIEPDRLRATVDRFNASCATGRDLDFGRGESVWDRYKSRRAPDQAGNPALGRIERPPFLAMPLDRSVLGTKGGARTNADGQVLRADGSVIAGLYCAGNAMANPIGTRALGSGTTIGPCMTWGYIAGTRILTGNR